jgi:hypothetical protein
MKRLLIWLFEPKLLYFFLFLTLLGLKPSLIPLNLQLIEKIKIYGLIMQIIGAVIIIYSLYQRHILFNNRGNIINAIKDYFKRFPFFKKKKHVTIKANSVSMSLTSGNLRLKVNPKENFEDVVRYINDEVNYLDGRIAELKTTINRDRKNSNVKFTQLKNENLKEISETKNLVQKSIASNISLDLFGIFSIIIGIIYGTIPDLVEIFIRYIDLFKNL